MSPLLYRRINKISLNSAMIVVSILMLIPYFYMLLTAFKSTSELNSPVFHLFPQSPTLANFLGVLKSGNWALWIWNTFYISAVVTVLSLVFNSLAGFALARLDFKGKHLLFMLLMVGVMIPPEVMMVPVFIIMKHFPLVGGNDLWGNGGRGFTDSYGGLMVNRLSGAFGVFLCRQFYMGFPKELDDAAEMDGCSVIRRFVQLYLPLSKPLLASLAILKLTSTWNDYLWPLIITTKPQLRTVQLALALYKNDYVDWGNLMAATTIISLPLFLLFLMGQKYFIEGIVTTGIKG